MMEIIENFLREMADNKLIEAVVTALICDIVFGVLASVKERRFDTRKGVDGAIRKVGMVLSLVFMQMADVLLNFNLIAFVPAEVKDALGISTVGFADFFSLLYLLFEATSIVKNMYLCGLPVKKIYEWLQKLSEKYMGDAEAKKETV